ncbi:hypothetical protein OKA05_27455 [Luteolibacter arcticus]|uniref:Uncharacterized protein n=1 Tax=Luteolibacter arcticus TaxID=1581411 RepID=A0ABT3GS12_9BACT|nr:hypothetical protein [Luteolibacter arcticus]MCW1926322.1 hypothetical protein [Luteolibacter arcticus]
MIPHRWLIPFALVATVAAETPPVFSPVLREAYLADARSKVLAAATPELMTWLDRHPEILSGLLTSSDPVPAHHVAQLDEMRRALGPEKSERYASLLLAVSLRAPDGGPASAKPADARVEAVAAHLKTAGLSVLQAREMGDAVFKEAKVEVPGKREAGAFWEDLAHATGTYPRRENMELADSLKLLIERYETKLEPFSSGPQWPLYAIDQTPWPLLAPLRQTLPRSEADYLWDHFRGETPYADGSRWKTYSRYSWDYDRVPAVRWKVSAFHPNSVPRIAEDGGVCGRLSTLGQFSCTALGKPAVGMYQPGHRAMLSYNRDSAGLWFAKLEQSITGPDRSTAQWLLPAPQGQRVSGSEASGVKVGVEWHVALNLAMNAGLGRWQDARVALFSARRLREKDPATAVRLAEEATALNPYLLEAWYQLADWSRGDLAATNALLVRFDTLLLDPTKAAEDHAELSASTDFNDLKPVKGGANPKKDSTLVANVVAPFIAAAAYSPALADKSLRAAAYGMLKQEIARREALKMPYGAPVRELELKFEVAVDGPRAAQQRLEKRLADLLKLDGKRRGKAAPEWLGELSAVAGGLPDAKDRAEWFARLQRDIPKDIAVTRSKDGKAAPDAVFKGLHDLQVREFRSLGKAGQKELKRLNEAWAAATTI